MKRISILLLLTISLNAVAQDFKQYFDDATLRIDYIFSGNAKHQAIAVDELYRLPHWFGKHERLIVNSNRIEILFIVFISYG